MYNGLYPPDQTSASPQRTSEHLGLFPLQLNGYREKWSWATLAQEVLVSTFSWCSHSPRETHARNGERGFWLPRIYVNSNLLDIHHLHLYSVQTPECPYKRCLNPICEWNSTRNRIRVGSCTKILHSFEIFHIVYHLRLLLYLLGVQQGFNHNLFSLYRRSRQFDLLANYFNYHLSVTVATKRSLPCYL